jgi:hypothetical protein
LRHSLHLKDVDGRDKPGHDGDRSMQAAKGRLP